MNAFPLPVLSDSSPEDADDVAGQTGWANMVPALREDLRYFDGEAGAAEAMPTLKGCIGALRRCARDGQAALVPLDGLSDAARGFIDGMLGRGEVSLSVAGKCRYEAHETVLVGLWHVTTSDTEGRLLSRHLEVGPVPQVVAAAALTATRTDLAIGTPPAGAMNVLSVLAELKHRAQAYQPGQPNHVMSFSLFPMNEVDMAYLEQQLGHGPVRGESKGFSHCRVELTEVRNVWSVKHFNNINRLVLDTIEVGGVPNALTAEQFDFEDSAQRLAEWLDTAVA